MHVIRRGTNRAALDHDLPMVPHYFCGLYLLLEVEVQTNKHSYKYDEHGDQTPSQAFALVQGEVCTNF